MKKTLKKWLANLVEPQIVEKEIRVPYQVVEDRVIVLENAFMNSDEYLFAFLVDDNTPFFRAIMQLCREMKKEYLDQCQSSNISDRGLMDAIAKMSAIHEFVEAVYTLRQQAIRKRDDMANKKT